MPVLPAGWWYDLLVRRLKGGWDGEMTSLETYLRQLRQEPASFFPGRMQLDFNA